MHNPSQAGGNKKETLSHVSGSSEVYVGFRRGSASLPFFQVTYFVRLMVKSFQDPCGVEKGDSLKL